MTKICPRCFLPTLADNEVLNSLSHDGKTYVCSQCGQIESLERLDPMRAQFLKLGQKRAQAGLYGLDKNRNPKLPSVNQKLEIK
jgi:hypothetical protein